jgi:hypothetical protein
MPFVRAEHACLALEDSVSSFDIAQYLREPLQVLQVIALINIRSMGLAANVALAI